MLYSRAVRSDARHAPSSRPSRRNAGAPASPRRAPRSRSLAPWLVLGVCAVTFAVYAGAFDNGFVDWDDQDYVTENPLVLARDHGGLLRAVVSNHYHPLTMLSLAANVSVPLTATPFVITNVVLHVLNTALVAWLVLLLVPGRPLVAALAALLFGIHPMHVESVAWVAERKDVLYALFFFGAAIAYVHFLDRQRPLFLALTFVLFIASCLAKEMAIAFPGVMVLLDAWRKRRLLEPRALLEKVPFALVSVLFAAIVLDLQGGGDANGLLRVVGERAVVLSRPPGLTALDRLTVPTYGFMMYAWRFFVPLDLCAFYPFPGPAEARTWPFLVAPVFFLGTAGLALWSLRRAPVVAFALAWFFVTVVLVLRWIPAGLVIMGDRYTYVAYVGLCLLAAVGIQTAAERWPAWRPVLWGAAAIFAVWLVVLCRAQIETWRNSETLWTRVIEVEPRVAWAHLYRGKYLANTGRFAEAGRDFQSAHDLGLRNGEVLGGLGIALGAMGRFDSSLVMLDRAIELEPRRPALYFNRAVTYLNLGRPREALGDLDRERELARVVSPGHAMVRGHAELRLGNARGALAAFDDAIRTGTADLATLHGRAQSRLLLGDRAGAAADFAEILRRNPADTTALRRLRALDAPARAPGS